MKYLVTIKYHGDKTVVEVDADSTAKAIKMVEDQYFAAWDGSARVILCKPKEDEPSLRAIYRDSRGW